MFKRIYLGLCFLLFLGVMYLAIITFKPITKVYAKDVAEVTGIVTAITPGSGGDIYIKLKNDPHNYYINNAISLGLKIKELQKLLLNQPVKLCHIIRWTPLTRDKVFPHLSKITHKDRIIFNEIITTHD